MNARPLKPTARWRAWCECGWTAEAATGDMDTSLRIAEHHIEHRSRRSCAGDAWVGREEYPGQSVRWGQPADQSATRRTRCDSNDPSLGWITDMPREKGVSPRARRFTEDVVTLPRVTARKAVADKTQAARRRLNMPFNAYVELLLDQVQLDDEGRPVFVEPSLPQQEEFRLKSA